MTASQALRKAGVRSTHFYAASLGSIGLCVGLWIRAKTVDQDERGTPNAGPCSSASGRRCSG